MLSPLQERLWRLVAGLQGAETVALAGGAALIVRGFVDRPTRDLDFYATSPEEVNRLLPTLEALLTESGLEVRRVQVADGFARLLVSSEVETTTVDLTWDARRFPLEQTESGAILADEELAADKLLALFGRAAARDFGDVAALASRYGLERLCILAAEKDPGFDRSVLADMLRSFDRLPRADFEVVDSEFDRLSAPWSGAGANDSRSRPARVPAPSRAWTPQSAPGLDRPWKPLSIGSSRFRLSVTDP